MTKNNILRVVVGRFAPLHKGHRLLIGRLIKRYGLKNCLILIGSVNILDNRTPYSFKSREKMIRDAFPDINILPIKDVGDDSEWLDIVEKIQNKLSAKFVFYGGSDNDLEILSRRFETHVLVNRQTEGRGINATQIREALRKQGKLPDFG